MPTIYIYLPHSVYNLMSGFDKSGHYTYLPTILVGIEMVGTEMVVIEMVSIKMVGIENTFVAKRFQCLPSLHLVRTVFGRYRL